MSTNWQDEIHKRMEKERLARKILGVNEKADAVAIKKAFWLLAMQYHPDKCPRDEEARKRFANIVNAYEFLVKGKEDGWSPGAGVAERSKRRRVGRFHNAVMIINIATSVPYVKKNPPDFTKGSFSSKGDHQNINQVESSIRTSSQMTSNDQFVSVCAVMPFRAISSDAALGVLHSRNAARLHSLCIRRASCDSTTRYWP